MIITAFFSACMAIVIYLFVLSGNLMSPMAWVYALFLFVLFFGMLRTRKFSGFRRIFLVTFALLFTISYIGNLRDAFGSVILGESAVLSGAIPFNQFLIPVMPFFIAFARTVQFPAPMTGGLLSVFGLILVWLMASIMIGKGWCGWVCPFGGYEEGFSRVLKNARFSLSRHGKRLRVFQIAFLAAIVLVSAILLSPVYAYWLNPFSVITGHFSSGNISGTIAIAVSAILFASLVIIFPVLTRKRFQCSAYCPLGALQSLMSGLSSFKVTIDADTCDQCMKCVEACQFIAIDEGAIASRKRAVSMACANCGECVDICPKKAIRFEYSFMKDGRARPEAKSVRGKILHGLLDPALIFAFSAFTFSVFVSAHFAIDALDRVISLVGVIL